MNYKISARHFFLSAMLLIVCAISSAKGGDGNPFLPKKISIELTSPFAGRPEYTFEKAIVILVFGPDEKGVASWEMRYACLNSIEVQLGPEKLSVPSKIVDDIRRPDLSEMSFIWFAGQYVLSFSAQLGGDQYGKLQFFWEDATLVRFTFDHKDMKESYPLSLPVQTR